tara:strand:+ start:77 stop:508 length:432 start_codon:yes stop_codon:yes gene_type:complete
MSDIIDEITASLMIEEGFRAHAYYDTAVPPRLTIGFGRNIDREGGGLGISEDEAELMLRNDIDRSVKECENWYWFERQPDRVKRVLIELCFQLGYPSLSNFNRMLTAISNDNYSTAADELLDSKFAREQVPHRAKRLADRLRG